MKKISKTKIIVSASLVLMLLCSIVGIAVSTAPSSAYAEGTQVTTYVFEGNDGNVYRDQYYNAQEIGFSLNTTDVSDPYFDIFAFTAFNSTNNLGIMCYLWFSGTKGPTTSMSANDALSLRKVGSVIFDEDHTYCEDQIYLSRLAPLLVNTAVDVYFGVCEFPEQDEDTVWESIVKAGTITKYVTTQKPLPAIPSKTGYTFTGWYTNEACTELYTKDYITDNITLYAGFKANTYTINFDGNKSVYANVTGSTASLSMTYDQANALPECGFTNAGYKFVGWSTNKNATSATYNAGQSVRNLSSINGDTITLYAVWAESQYIVKFNANGGNGSMSDQIVLRDISTPLKANSFSRTGYTFTGWATSTTGSVTYYNEQSVLNIATLDSPITLYAVWKVNTYTVNFDANGGIGSMSSQSMTYGVVSKLNNCQFTRTGYVFKGWSTTKDGSVVYKNLHSVSNLSSANGSSITLYAVWEPIQCVVTFIVDGEVYAVVSVDWGTPAVDLIGQAVNSVLYEVVDENSLPN